MRRHKLLYISLALVLSLAILNLVAIEFYFYWTLWWFDNMMHLLGGFSLGFLFLYIFYESGILRNKLSFSKAILLSFIFTMIAGGAWEVFEYYNDLSLFTERFDTLHDLMADALGTTLALLVARWFLKVS